MESDLYFPIRQLKLRFIRQLTGEEGALQQREERCALPMGLLAFSLAGVWDVRGRQAAMGPELGVCTPLQPDPTAASKVLWKESGVKS